MMYSCVLLVVIVGYVSGHGYLQDPPSRNAMWKYGFSDAPKNYNLNENFCGGIQTQYQKNGGKCGICGDPYNQKSPRRHEVGGSMYDGRIVRTYKAGQTIDVKVHLTANHKGTMVFKLCKNKTNPKREVTQECLDKNQLEVEGSKVFKVKSGIYRFNLKVKLPPRFKCKRCVLQWHYRAGNNWGCSKKGDWKSCGSGKGPQETFVNCADIAIN